MKRIVTVSVVIGGFLAITQLLIFWLLPVSSEAFPAAYPIYTCLSVFHSIVFAVAYLRHGFPTAFAPVAAGSVIALLGMTAMLLLGLFGISVRTIVFSGAIALVFYLLISVVLLSIAERESPHVVVPESPVTPYMDNTPDRTAPNSFADTCSLQTCTRPIKQGERRMPRPVIPK